MFASSTRRAPPKPAGNGTATPATTVKPTLTTTTTVRVAVSTSTRPPPRPAVASSSTTAPAASSPLSSVQSLASSPPASRPTGPPKIGITVKKTQVTVVQRSVAPPTSPRTVNALKRPLAVPAKKEKEGEGKKGGKKGKGKGRAVSDSEEEEDDSRPKKKKRTPPTVKRASSSSSTRRAAASASSELDPLTPSSNDEDDDEDSGLSSPDEDYFAKTPKKADGAPVSERDVRATGEGEMDAKSAESLVLENKKAYVDYFCDPSDPQRPATAWAGSEVPTVELEYPADGATERFALLAPRTDDEYNPIEDVLRTILTILDHFLTPDQAAQYFAHLPGKTSFSAFLYNKSTSSSRAGTPAAGTPRPGTPVPMPTAAAAPSASEPAQSIPTPPPSVAPTDASSAPAASPSSSSPAADASSSTSAADAPPPPPSESLIRLLEKARSKRDGPSFLSHLSHFNSTLRYLKRHGILRDNVGAMKGVREKVWQKVFYQCYDRAVGPEMEELRRYEAFSDNVYGELLPGFMNEIFEKTHLGPGKVFVDLGSGVGNCVLQAALATGATSYGFENMAHASRLARLQVVEAQKRFRMWGLGGGEMQVVEADFCEHPMVGEVMRRADVVLVNNEVFTSSLNERLSWLFLDLPNTAKIISLKPFLSTKSHHTITSHNVHSPFAILSQSPALRYKPGSVSWKMEGGTYFLSRVDRSRVERFLRKEGEREEKRRMKSVSRSMSRSASAASGGGGSGAGSRAASKGV
ncbi:hypothetical protein JCM8097_001174 [Rhodosporidiobolus ruineniae]